MTLRKTQEFAASRRSLLQVMGIASASTIAGPAFAGTMHTRAAAPSLLVKTAATDISSLPRVKQKMVAPPFLPEHEQVAADGPKVVEVILTIDEKKMELSPSNMGNVLAWVIEFMLLAALFYGVGSGDNARAEPGQAVLGSSTRSACMFS